MRKQWIVLGVVLGLVLLVYGWVFLRPGPALDVTLMNTPTGPMFTFNGRVELYEVKVTQTDPPPEADDDDEEPGVVWHLVPRDVEDVDPTKVLTVIYGQPRGLGLRPAPGTRGRGRTLEPGHGYLFEADTSGGEVEMTFTMP